MQAYDLGRDARIASTFAWAARDASLRASRMFIVWSPRYVQIGLANSAVNSIVAGCLMVRLPTPVSKRA